MKQASEQYREDMKLPFRNKWQLSMYIGLIKERFQTTASLSLTNSDLSLLSSPNYNNYLFGDTSITDNIATFEKNMIKADGTAQFTDEEFSPVQIGYFGVVSYALSNEDNSIRFSFNLKSQNGEQGLKGLTLHFFETYPTQFNIVAKSKGTEVFNKVYENNSLVFKTTDDFGEESDELVINVLKMNKPYVRFRLRYILFGIGVQFNNTDFLSSGGELSSFMHSRSVELPTCDLSLKLDNYENKFDFDNAESLINLAEVGQDVILQVQYIHFDGTIENIPTTSLELSSFDVENDSLSLKAVDFLRNENTPVVFDDPSFFKSNTTLYDVAMEVKKTLTNPTFDVILDNSLKDIPMKFSHIETSTKEAFLGIASAAGCIMDLKDKNLYIRRVNSVNSTIKVESNNKVPYSDLDITSLDKVTDFASFEKNRVLADGTFLIPDVKNNSMFKTGYISESISDENGLFEIKPSFSLVIDKALSPSLLSMSFSTTYPKHFIIKTFYDNTSIETLEYDNLDGYEFELLYDFQAFNKMTIEFVEVNKPYSRIYVGYTVFDNSPYDFNKTLYLNNVPKGMLLDLVRNIIVYYTTSTKDENGDFKDTKKSVTIKCNAKGSDIEYDNPFVTTEQTASELAQWLKQYYSARIQYDFEYVGDPTLEVNDVIRLENEYNNNVLCDIEENNLIFSNGGIRGKIVARRRNDNVV